MLKLASLLWSAATTIPSSVTKNFVRADRHPTGALTGVSRGISMRSGTQNRLAQADRFEVSGSHHNHRSVGESLPRVPLGQVRYALGAGRNGTLSGADLQVDHRHGRYGKPLQEDTCECWSSEIEFATLLRQLAAATVR
jgi:hypothetical protein